MRSAAAPLYLQATTACLAGIIVTQIADVFACRRNGSGPEAAVKARIFEPERMIGRQAVKIEAG
jgi:hypothetical protein